MTLNLEMMLRHDIELHAFITAMDNLGLAQLFELCDATVIIHRKM